MSQQSITIVDYNPNWKTMFEAEKALLAKCVEQWICGSIEHVGSTAVTGLAAKPVIDIMVGVESLEDSRNAIDVLSDNGYRYYPYKADIMHWFCKPAPEIRTHHLHLVPYESTLWQERIQFRDCLRHNTQLANEYAQLKYTLANKYGNDRELYTLKKWPFIQNVLASID